MTVNEANYETGRDNFFRSAAGLESAPGVFAPATSATNAATGAGSSAEETAKDISAQNNSWLSAVTGALGGIAGNVVTGGMKNLGAGVGFFGQNAPPPVD